METRVRDLVIRDFGLAFTGVYVIADSVLSGSEYGVNDWAIDSTTQGLRLFRFCVGFGCRWFSTCRDRVTSRPLMNAAIKTTHS